MRARNRRGEGSRLGEDIVAAAGRLVDVEGPEALTLRAVAREVGIAAPSIYAHFSDREAILVAVIQQGFVELIGQIEDARDRHDDPVARLRAGCAAYLGFAEHRPQRYDLMFRADLEGHWPFGAEGDQAAVAFSVLVDGIADCVAAGRSDSTDTFADATALWVAMHGLGSLYPAHPHFPWPDPTGLLDRLIYGLARILSG